ncbi:MAG: DNA polymerase IV, partial [Pseudomonadota bacterium]
MSWSRIIAHADMDAFYASVEQLDDPSLRGKPVIVGPRSQRGVVLTASYEARKFGVKSAMPAVQAVQRCPQGIFVPPRFERYQQLSAQIMQAFGNFSPVVEALSLDEAFIDMTGAEGLFGSPQQMGEQIRQAVFDATGGLTASVGVSGSKYVAKVASDFNKPNAVTVVAPRDAIEWLSPMPVSRLWGAGPKTVPRLEKIGLYTIGDVRNASDDFLRRHLGSAGLHFKRLAHAQDQRTVARRRVARSMGSDRTLEKDVSTPEEIQYYLRRSADRLGERLRRKGYCAGGVRVRLKCTRFNSYSRQVLLPQPTDNAQLLFDAGVALLPQFEHRGPYRLVGLAVYELRKADAPEQFGLQFTEEIAAQKNLRLEQTVDDIADKFGSGAMTRAGSIGKTGTVSGSTPNL